MACHVGPGLNPDRAGTIALEGLPERYQPGQRYSLHLSVSDPDPSLRRFGFQLTALATSTLTAAGELVVIDPERTQRIDALDGGRQYLGHTLAGTGADSDGGARWRFEWVAPPSDVGPVGFFAAANAADLDGSQAGDHVYSRSPSPLAFVAGPSASKEEP